jgi:hypothetical protein
MQLPYSNLTVKQWNPGAENPLILPVHLVCNTSDEALYSNIRENSRRPGKWVKLEDAHDGVAVLCGSGPSLADNIEEVRLWQMAGAKVFAMNGAAQFLNDNGILADYQVIIDAREQTADLVGPAKEHLFASQVHPKCFERMPSAQVWHLQVGDIENEFPEYEGGYALIGGAASVGNTATCLAYTLGYRTLQIYGYDSSHREGKGHAFHQAMNAGDPCCSVTFGGKEYICSLTMKLQAEKFMETSFALKQCGCKIAVHGSGLLPDMYNAPPLPEIEKYRIVWANPEYRLIAPGEYLAETFVRIARPEGIVADFGCGTGRGALAIEKLTECQLLLIDFAANCRDEEAERLPFIQCDLTKMLPVKADFGYCTDVMEHIPPRDVDHVIRNLLRAAPRVFFQICLIPDAMGGLIGQPLHLSVHPFQWWAEVFTRLGYRIAWSEDKGDTALFYIVR